MTISHFICRKPTESQINDYDNEMVRAVRTSDLPTITRMVSEGRSSLARNKFSESIMHMACRNSSFEVVKFLYENGGRFDQVDDYGRTPMHDACWRAQPHFELIKYILDIDRDLVRSADARGATPLDYVQREHWDAWKLFIHQHKHIYWAPVAEDKYCSKQQSETGERAQSPSPPSNQESEEDGGHPEHTAVEDSSEVPSEVPVEVAGVEEGLAD